jgi:hypothetical protein
MKLTPREAKDLEAISEALGRVSVMLAETSPLVREVFFELVKDTALLRAQEVSAEHSAPDKKPRCGKEKRVSSTTRRRDFVRVVR